MKPQLINDLIRLGTGESEHSGRSLLNHLQGVYDLLEQWGNPVETCLAGLFHSIYGTAYYKKKTVALNQRGNIKDLIGARAEELAYLFCACDRKHFLRNFTAPGVYTLKDLFREAEITISDDTFKALVEIAFANLLEQLPRINPPPDKQILRNLFEGWKTAKPYVSAKAYQQFLDYFNVTLNMRGKHLQQNQDRGEPWKFT